MINGHKKLFQLPNPCKIAIAANAGVINGIIIRKKIPYSVEPSIRAASINSLGNPNAYCRKKNTAIGATIAGSITPVYVSINPQLIINWYSGSINISNGTIKINNTSTKKNSYL